MTAELQLANCARFRWIPAGDTTPTMVKVWKHCNDSKGGVYPVPMLSQSHQETCVILLERYLSEQAGKKIKLTIYHYAHLNHNINDMILTWSSK